jgi:hypothetical protein
MCHVVAVRADVSGLVGDMLVTLVDWSIIRTSVEWTNCHNFARAVTSVVPHWSFAKLLHLLAST